MEQWEVGLLVAPSKKKCIPVATSSIPSKKQCSIFLTTGAPAFKRNTKWIIKNAKKMTLVTKHSLLTKHTPFLKKNVRVKIGLTAGGHLHLWVAAECACSGFRSPPPPRLFFHGRTLHWGGASYNSALFTFSNNRFWSSDSCGYDDIALAPAPGFGHHMTTLVFFGHEWLLCFFWCFAVALLLGLCPWNINPTTCYQCKSTF